MFRQVPCQTRGIWAFLAKRLFRWFMFGGTTLICGCVWAYACARHIYLYFQRIVNLKLSGVSWQSFHKAIDLGTDWYRFKYQWHLLKKESENVCRKQKQKKQKQKNESTNIITNMSSYKRVSNEHALK